MKSAKFQNMLNQEDFWWFFIWRMETGQQDLAEAVIAYERDHIATGKPFGSPDQTEADGGAGVVGTT
jgi:hypothetical protein